MTSFQDKIDFLKQNGWIERSSISFIKNGFEIFGDTSNAVEIYPDNDNKKRLFDIRIETIDELQKLIEGLKEI
jgi:uncharacterized protein YdeI (YjbR/CyaY-like superfamily)